MNRAQPPELIEVGLHGFTWSDSKSLRGPCPKCGGSRRFVVFVSRPWPSWYGMCDGCGSRGWLDQILNKDLGATEIDQNALDRAIDAQKLRDDYRRQRLSEFSTEELWIEYAERLEDEQRDWWRLAGIPDEWQTFWRLGYEPAKHYEFEKQIHTSPAYVIPKFDIGWIPTQIDYRLTDAPKGAGKYRQVVDLPPAFFLARPDESEFSETGRLLIVEGSKKAMVTYQLFTDRQVAGIPGCTSWGKIEEKAQGLDEVFVILDPGAGEWSYRLASKIKGARVLDLPAKIDDAILDGHLDRPGLERLFKHQIRRANWNQS
jgi:hypothetical protein